MTGVAGPPDDPDARRLLNHLVGAVQRSIRMANDFAIAFDGGLPSSLLALVAREQSDVPFTLIHARTPTSDVEKMRSVARHLGVPLLERVRPDPPAGAVDEIRTVLREAALLTRRVILPLGAAPSTEGNAPSFANALQGESPLQLRYPFLDRGFAPFYERLASESTLAPATWLRRAGAVAGLPGTLAAGPPS